MPGKVLLFAAIFLLIGSATGRALPRPEITVSSERIDQGETGFVKVRTAGRESPRIRWMDREFFMASEGKRETWVGFFGSDLKLSPGLYPLAVSVPSTGFRRQIDITVRPKDYGVRRLTLPKEMVDLDPVTLKRVKKEAGIMKQALDASSTVPYWTVPFVKPVSGEVIGPFGQTSIINGMPRSPHSGVDLRGETGTPVAAVNNGRVVLTGDYFFSGLFVVVDHGGDIQSMYFHLDKILVREGDQVSKGRPLGLMGATGRATGPHLHFGMRVNGARIDPVPFLNLNESVERR